MADPHNAVPHHDHHTHEPEKTVPATPAVKSVNNWKGPQPGPLALLKLIQANFPETGNDGIYNDRNIAGSTRKSLHATGRAVDLKLSVSISSQKEIADRLFDIFIDNAVLVGFQEIIWNKEIWSLQQPVKHAYKGLHKDPHTGHIHVGFTEAASQQTSFPSKFLIALGVLRTGREDERSGWA